MLTCIKQCYNCVKQFGLLPLKKEQKLVLRGPKLFKMIQLLFKVSGLELLDILVTTYLSRQNHQPMYRFIDGKKEPALLHNKSNESLISLLIRTQAFIRLFHLFTFHTKRSNINHDSTSLVFPERKSSCAQSLTFHRHGEVVHGVSQRVLHPAHVVAAVVLLNVGHDQQFPMIL